MMTKRELARHLSEIAFFLRLKDDNPYKSAAYERAGRALLLSPHEPHQLLRPTSSQTSLALVQAVPR